ncbi:MAG TPA: hypothetical protein VGL48_00060 [Acidimicrobiales bacterium]|jgi:hypothetical protein
MSPFVLATRTPVHLYAAFLGGDLAEGRMGEDHEVVDAVTRLDRIDGFDISLDPSGSGDATHMEGYN